MFKTPDGWHRIYLAQIAYIQTGIAKGSKPSGDTVELPYLRVANVQDGYLDLEEVKTLQVDRKKISRYLLQRGDVLLTEGGDFDKLGRGTIWQDEIVTCLHQNHVFAIRLNQQKILPYFFALQAGSPYGKQYFLSCAKRTTNLASINKTQLSKFPVLLPPLPEQRKIAQILGTWDDAIATVEQLIVALEWRKKGLMQRLLTRQVRFPEFAEEEWEEVQLGQFLKYSPRKVEKPSSAYKRMGIRSHGKGTFTEIVEDPDSNSMDYLYEVKGDDLIVSITFAWEHAIAIVSEQDAGALVSHRFPTYEFNRKKVVSEFFRYLMLTERFLYQLDLISPGGAGRNRVMSKTDFLKLRVTIPSLAEQKRIGKVLMVADQQIDALKIYLEALQQQKKGLMQRLLTGQVRVRVDSVS